jgi:methylenetetrahydrofolate reductase (NADPH)
MPATTDTPAVPSLPSRLRAALQAGRFAITAEITPPASADVRELLAKALPLRGLADAVNVTDGASARTHLSALAASALLLREGVEPVLQLTCRDRNRIALQSDLLGAAAFGVCNLLMLRGDDPSRGDQPDAKPVFDLDSRGLTRTAAQMRDQRTLPGGRAIGGAPDFFIGAADSPIDPPEGWRADGLIQKLEAGAQFAQTQFCMDPGVLARYMARLVEQGVTGRLSMLIGVAPLASARSARWMRENLFGTVIADEYVERMEAASDPRAAGQAICLELIERYAAIPGVAGVHIMAPLNEPAVPEVIVEARRRLGARAAG